MIRCSFAGAVTIAAALALLMSCSPGEDAAGNGSPPPTPQSTTTTTTPETAASPRLSPPLPAQLNVGPLLDDPCQTMTAEQSASWGVSAPRRADPELEFAGPSCRFVPDDRSRPTVSVTVNTESGGLEGIYLRRQNYEQFDPIEVLGQPAVIANESVSETQRGACALFVGATDNVVFTAVVLVQDLNSPEYTSPCPLAERVGTQVVETVRGEG